MKKPLLLPNVVLMSLFAYAAGVQAGTARVETDESDPTRQWQINGSAVNLNTNIDVSTGFDAGLNLDGLSNFKQQKLSFLNSANQTPLSMTATVYGVVPNRPQPAHLISNANQSLVSVVGVGSSDLHHNTGAVGPTINGTIKTSVYVALDGGKYNANDGGPTSVYHFRSQGADGNSDESGFVAADPFGANGGNVSVDLYNYDSARANAITASGTLAQGSSSLPWEAGAALLSAVSQGGQGTVRDALPFDGGFGGNVSVWTDQNAVLTLDVNAKANSPVVGLLALSRGGKGSTVDDRTGHNGKGGEVDVTFSSIIEGSKPYSMGIVAASVGAASQYETLTRPSASGGGSNVSVRLEYADINLSSTNTIGVVATSTAENPKANGSIGGSGNSYRDVLVSLDSSSSISVGNTTDTATATDTTIGVLANSAVGWSSQPFLGTAPSSMSSPGSVGNVTIENKGSITALGSGAIGVLAQSIAGNGASASGGVLSFIGDSGGAGGTAGKVTYKGDGGKITAKGAGATGLLMQSIAGGGGDGGNAAGLFVAVGGHGGHGGEAGTVSFSQKNRASITTEGNYAQGVVLQSVGGGGGNGGHSSSYSVGVPTSTSIGGRGGIGGDGGTLEFGGLSDSGSDQTSTITTSGQHAHGVVAHTIGSGGGKGGAAHSYDGGVGLNVALGVGGDGGHAGNGGDIKGVSGAPAASSFGDVITTGHDAIGMLLQSIGGGGGVGGASTADAFSTLSIPEVPNINVGIAVGGTGGMGGNGGKINFDLANNMTTRGAFSHGFVLQSVGGGGGVGGDATAGAAAILANNEFTMNTTLGLGGDGGAGGKGGAIVLGLSGTQATRGHGALAILAQSIGGGGGAGGVGNAASVVAIPLEEKNYQLGLSAGGKGGSGATGGSITATTHGDSVLSTLGSGAPALVAQSVGGGGGVAGNAGSQGIGGKLTTKVSVGGDGGSGNHGGNVSVLHSGKITTGGRYQVQYQTESGETALTTPIAIGGSSHGIVAQSIGGGGGMAGNADPAKSILPDLAETIIDDVNKIMDAKGTILWIASRVVNWQKEEHEFPKSYSVSLAVGGTGGAGGNGGDVDVTLEKGAQIVTQGHRSYGIFAQSVGGGGGEAGEATGDAILDADAELSPLTGADFSLGINVGGGGGAAGDGGAVSVHTGNFGSNQRDNFITTAGYASHAVFMQSVGGGGGVGHEGSIFGLGEKLAGADVPTITLGKAPSSSGASGKGGEIYYGALSKPASQRAWITTAGDDAAAIFAQSVGGAGGTATMGCTNSGLSTLQATSACHTNAETATSDTPFKDVPKRFVNGQQSYKLSISPQGGAWSDGGSVSLLPGAGTYTTTGNRSPAFMAQSIGGGGGYITTHNEHIESATINGINGGTGGDILVDLRDVAINTSGHGAWGVLAQSVGSGGGVLADLAGEVTFENTAISSSRKGGQHGGDITVTVRSGSDINVGTGMTSVANAHGIVAQSLGSSGGLRSDGDKLVFDGKNSSVSDGYGGAITITVEDNASVSTDATGGIGILAHSSGQYANHDKKGITVQVDGDVSAGYTGNSPITGHHLDGVGVMVMGGAVKDSGFANTINVNGRVMLAYSDAKGYGIKTDYGITNINNFGLIQGSVDMGSTPGTLTNNQSGTLEMGSIYRVGNNSLHNYGTLQVGTEQSVSTTTLYGTMHQYEGGRLVFTVDAASSGDKHDKLVVDGTANLGGVIEVYADSLLPGSYAFIDATNLNFTGSFADALLYDWVPTFSASGLSATPTANFNGAHLNLRGTAASLADYIARGWQSADVAKAGLFAHLHHVETSEKYQETLEQLGGQQFQAQTQQMVASSFGGFNDALRCPRDGMGVRQGAQGCVWAEATGNHTRQTEQSENLGFSSEGGGVRMGAQRALNDVVTLGSAFGVNRNRLTSTGFSSKGNAFDATVSLSRDVGNWTFSGAVMAAYGRFHNDRTVDFGAGGASRGINATYSSRSTTTLLGARLRAAYNMSFNNYYLRPLVDVDILHSRSPSFTESDSGPLQLEVGSAKQTQIVVSPTLETGASFDVGSETLMRAYAGVGVSMYSDAKHTSQNRFNKALTSSGTFTSEQDTPSVLGRLSLGVEFAREDNLSFSAEYGLQAGGGYRSQNLNARLTYRF
ncbi:autotransporter outer membrane beta-barrel domain-containing protein [Neopusillimonas maritima]|uniref:Autotransporter domain-containing protein n=1 Tax=Neopusillimonas maritima TaxID=2026239 RepID=A0ABX9MTZ2_9BURK|nr:autotransporter outer membrane beta-barrel domain-containing protein [Neopusillimonas maritima]RII82041.1 hypothetical protein CJO09_13660 [Neopusillimonas maritima]